eukprot:scaffold248249_cov17-Tisochrysis_lutea.AAC.1
MPTSIQNRDCSAAGSAQTSESEVEALATTLFGEPSGQAPSPSVRAGSLPFEELGLQELGAVCGALLKGQGLIHGYPTIVFVRVMPVLITNQPSPRTSPLNRLCQVCHAPSLTQSVLDTWVSQAIPRAWSRIGQQLLVQAAAGSNGSPAPRIKSGSDAQQRSGL